MQGYFTQMPTITHALIGGGIALFLKTLTEKSDYKFKNEHLIIFALNSFVGPDFPKIIYPFVDNLAESPVYHFMNMFFHTLVGWYLAAFLLTFLYYAIFRYASVEGKKGNMHMTFFQMWLVILAGGICHFAVDFIDYGVFTLPSFSATGSYGLLFLGYENLKTGFSMRTGPLSSVFPWFSGGELLLIGILSMIILIWVLNNKELKIVYLSAAIFIVFMVAILLLFGGNAVYNENDLGYLAYFLYFILYPLFLTKFSMSP